jgi:MFS family permease
MPMALRRETTQRTAWFAIAAVFFVNGVTLASWISRIPTLTERLDLGPGQVGLALMALAAGALVAFPITGRLVDTRSSSFTVLFFGLVMLVSLPFVGLAPHLLGLILALFVLGFGNGGMDVAMNAQGIEVERFVGRSIINSLHGCFSFGAFTGAAIGAGVAQLNGPPLLHFLGVSVLGLAALSWIQRWLIPDTKRTFQNPTDARWGGRPLASPARRANYSSPHAGEAVREGFETRSERLPGAIKSKELKHTFGVSPSTIYRLPQKRLPGSGDLVLQMIPICHARKELPGESSSASSPLNALRRVRFV